MTTHVSYFRVLIKDAPEDDVEYLANTSVCSDPDTFYEEMHRLEEKIDIHSIRFRKEFGDIEIITNDARTIYALLRIVENAELEMRIEWTAPPKE